MYIELVISLDRINVAATASLAYVNNFLHRPIVNEYTEILWNMLKFLGISQKRKEKKFKLVLTHDVDNLSNGNLGGKFLEQWEGMF